jgi:hypothetical protein
VNKAKMALTLSVALLMPFGSNELFGWTARPQTSEDSAFCANLNSIIRSGSDNFHSLRGAPDPDYDGKGWESNISLPGSTECRTFEYGSPTVVCDFKTSTSETDLEDDYARLAKQLGNCLEKWSKTQDGPSAYSKSLIKDTRFKQAAITVRVDIYDKRSNKHPGYNLQIWVDKDLGD